MIQATTHIDSLHTQVNVIDTTITHVHVYDTIVTHVYSTVPPDLIAVYDKVIASQDSRFIWILSLLGVFVTLLVVVFAWFNIDVAKKLFRKEFEDIIKEEKPKIKEETIKELDKELNLIKAESARLFALSSNDNDLNLANKIFWWFKALEYYSKSDNTRLQKICINSLIEDLEKAVEKKEIFLRYFNLAEYSFEHHEKQCDHIHDTVSEKKTILNYLKQLEEYSKQEDAKIVDAIEVEETR
ncbi:hypothetical protein [Labilibaculum antarcticum]|uniref:Uncharacterized protein n=1 Tax=Labilibaculum antarcticum TaxID=1717717 RepID=A0A1Y1CNW5_9BACT|nr:hypothetical protein [Labilibaculum antarcticum]BAX81980.1 hypothetical protein ALGA_3688 [Labilibaculum antarcticum]